jgi:hypothetical protein
VGTAAPDAKHVEAQPVPAQPCPGLGMEGLLLRKWFVQCCALVDQPWAARPKAAPLALASKSAVEVEEGDMGLAAPADKGLPRVWWPTWRPWPPDAPVVSKAQSPRLQGVLPRDGRGPPGASPSQFYQGVEVGRLPCVVASAPGPPSDQEKFPQTLHDTRPGLLHTRLCPVLDP